MNRRSVLGGLALTAIAGTGYWLANAGATPPGLPVSAASAQESDAVDTSSVVEMALGPEDAKVTVIEYASFTCPHCASFHQSQFKQLKSDYIDTGKIRFIYRDVYFDRFGLWASMVARCAGPERFFGITDMIYAQQKDWIAGGDDPVEIANNLRKIGKVAGIDDDTLEACLGDNDKAKTLVAWFQENAEADGIDSTPTLVINGKKHSNMSYADLKEVIDAALEG